MGPEAWAALAVVFMLGAMSPGPSLAVILSNTISGGRRQGIATGLGHGIGFGIYAFLADLVWRPRCQCTREPSLSFIGEELPSYFGWVSDSSRAH